jgi:hypothetical protein
VLGGPCHCTRRCLSVCLALLLHGFFRVPFHLVLIRFLGLKLDVVARECITLNFAFRTYPVPITLALRSVPGAHLAYRRVCSKANLIRPKRSRRPPLVPRYARTACGQPCRSARFAMRLNSWLSILPTVCIIVLEIQSTAKGSVCRLSKPSRNAWLRLDP